MKPYYDRDGITLYCGDMRDVLPTLEAGSVDLVLTDPPYEVEAHTLQRRASLAAGVMELEPLPFGPMDSETRQFMANQSGTLCTKWVLTFCQIEAAPEWRLCYETAGFRYMRTCLWIKPDGMPQYSGDRPGMGYETILTMHGRGSSRWNGGGRQGVFTFNKNHGGGRSSLHPTEKPLPLIRELTELFSNPGDLVLDPFAGSGTTLVAARVTGRRAIGVEINEDYCRVIVDRLQGAAPDKRQLVLPLL